MTTPNAMPKSLNTAVVLPINPDDYRGNNLPLSIGQRLGMNSEIVEVLIYGQEGFAFRVTEASPMLNN